MKELSRQPIDLVAPPALGDTVISNAVVRHLLLTDSARLSGIRMWTCYPWLFRAFEGDPHFQCLNEIQQAPFDAIHLTAYLDMLPHRNTPHRHHTLSMLELVNNALGLKPSGLTEPLLPIFVPEQSAFTEAQHAWREVTARAKEKKIVWLTGRATSRNRNPDNAFWIMVAEQLKHTVQIVELLAPDEDPMDQMIIHPLKITPDAMPFIFNECTAGISVDTFGLHLAAACGFYKTVVVIGSSAPQCVCYPGNRPIYRKSWLTRHCQPCGNHGYVSEAAILRTFSESQGLHFHPDNGCIFDKVECLANIFPEDVVIALKEWL